VLTAAEEPATLLETGEGATKLLVAMFTDEIGTEKVFTNDETSTDDLPGCVDSEGVRSSGRKPKPEANKTFTCMSSAVGKDEPEG